MFILSVTSHKCVKKHVLWAEDDVISAESTIFAADFLTSSADFQRKIMFRVEITVKGQSRIVLTKIVLHD